MTYEEHKQIALEFIDDNLPQMKDMIMSITVFHGGEPNEELCGLIADNLFFFARTGSKLAAAMYCISAAYNKDSDIFSAYTAIALLFSGNAVKEYHDLVRDEFADIMDDEEYKYFYTFPAIEFFKQLGNSGYFDMIDSIEENDN